MGPFLLAGWDGSFADRMSQPEAIFIFFVGFVAGTIATYIAHVK